MEAALSKEFPKVPAGKSQQPGSMIPLDYSWELLNTSSVPGMADAGEELGRVRMGGKNAEPWTSIHREFTM